MDRVADLANCEQVGEPLDGMRQEEAQRVQAIQVDTRVVLAYQGRIAELESQLATQAADIKTLEENYDGLEVALTSIAKLCGKEWDSGYEEAIVVKLVAFQDQALREAEEYRNGIGALILRCQDALGDPIRGVDDADTLSQLFQVTISEKGNDETEIRLLKAECNSLRSQLEAAQQKLDKLVQPTLSERDAEESAASAVIATARCIRHWHDTASGGMVVSGEHVIKLWDALEAYDALSALPKDVKPATEAAGQRPKGACSECGRLASELELARSERSDAELELSRYQVMDPYATVKLLDEECGRLRAEIAKLRNITTPAPSLLRGPTEGMPEGCYCQPGRCMAPVLMGKQMPCREPLTAALASKPKSEGG